MESKPGVEGCGFRAQGFGFRPQGLGFRAQGLGFRAQGLGFKGSGLGLGVFELRDWGVWVCNCVCGGRIPAACVTQTPGRI